MKTLLCAAAMVAAIVFPAGVQSGGPVNPQCADYVSQEGGHIGLYVDWPSYSDWCLNETVYATNTIYVVHSWAPSSNTSRFRVLTNWTGLTPTVSYGSNLYLGDIFTGVTITYVGCKALPYLVATIGILPISPTPPCTGFRVVADPTQELGQIETVDCNYNVLEATGGGLWINTPDCGSMCEPPDFCGAPLAAEHATWGRVKSLYR